MCYMTGVVLHVYIHKRGHRAIILSLGFVCLLTFSISLQFSKCTQVFIASRGAEASRLLHTSQDRAVLVRALAGDIVLCSWARHFTLTVLRSNQVYKWVPVKVILEVTLQRTSISSRGSKNTSSCFMLQNLGELSSGLGFRLHLTYLLKVSFPSQIIYCPHDAYLYIRRKTEEDS